MYCGAAFAGSRGSALSLLFFCRRFLFQIKRKCRNAECIYHLIMVRSEGKSQLPTNHNCYGSVSAAPITDSRKGCPYGVRVNKIVQISRADSICPYPVLFHYSLLVITLSASETTSQPRLTPSQRPLQGRLIGSSQLSICQFIPQSSFQSPFQIPRSAPGGVSADLLFCRPPCESSSSRSANSEAHLCCRGCISARSD